MYSCGQYKVYVSFPLHGASVCVPCCAQRRENETERNVKRSHPVKNAIRTVYTWTCQSVFRSVVRSVLQAVFCAVLLEFEENGSAKATEATSREAK